MNTDLKGYYKCPKCNEEYISDIPYKVCNCLLCGSEIALNKLISNEEVNKIKSIWVLRKKEN